MDEAIGRRCWAIADGYIPGWSHGPPPEMESHEGLSILNTGGEPAAITVTAYFEDRDPAGPYRFTVEPRRTLHIRLEKLDDPEPIPRGRGYAMVVRSDRPVVVQQTRLDSRQAENAIFSTIAYAAG